MAIDITICWSKLKMCCQLKFKIFSFNCLVLCIRLIILQITQSFEKSSNFRLKCQFRDYPGLKMAEIRMKQNGTELEKKYVCGFSRILPSYSDDTRSGINLTDKLHVGFFYFAKLLTLFFNIIVFLLVWVFTRLSTQSNCPKSAFRWLNFNSIVVNNTEDFYDPTVHTVRFTMTRSNNIDSFYTHLGVTYLHIMSSIKI